MAMAYTYGRTADDMRDSINSIKNMEKECTFTQTAAGTKVNGKMECSMELDGSSMRRVLLSARESGLLASLNNGLRKMISVEN